MHKGLETAKLMWYMCTVHFEHNAQRSWNSQTNVIYVGGWLLRQNQWTKGINCTRQTPTHTARYTVTETLYLLACQVAVTEGGSPSVTATWHASNYKVHILHQTYRICQWNDAFHEKSSKMCVVSMHVICVWVCVCVCVCVCEREREREDDPLFLCLWFKNNTRVAEYAWNGDIHATGGWGGASFLRVYLLWRGGEGLGGGGDCSGSCFFMQMDLW